MDVEFVFFLFQAEDGIRDRDVTGVQTCALPISARAHALGEDTDAALYLALAFVLATSGLVAVAYLVAPELLVPIVVGSQYPDTAKIVGTYGIAALANALLSLWIAYFIGRGEMRVGLL